MVEAFIGELEKHLSCFCWNGLPEAILHEHKKRNSTIGYWYMALVAP